MSSRLKNSQDYINKTIGNFKILSICDFVEGENTHAICQCVCGNTKKLLLYDVKAERIKSCGCIKNKKAAERCYKHGMSFTRIYRIWKGIITRCHCPSSTSYHNYGDRGITVCDEWKNFIPFKEWAFANGYTDELTIERKNNNLGYSPDNCKWATYTEQHHNMRCAKSNRSGFRGVVWCKSNNNWIASINITKKQKTTHLGCFDKLEDAIDARKQAEIKYWGACKENMRDTKSIIDDSAIIRNNCKRVIQFDKGLNIINEYESITKAQEATGIRSSNISSCCNGNLKTSGGYIWKHAE